MKISELKYYVPHHQEAIIRIILESEYLCKLINGAEISKQNGKIRLLEIPRVIDD